jgi:hypothetical protein
MGRRQADFIRKNGMRLSRGVYVERLEGRDPKSLLNRARGALAVAPPGSMVCGLSALGLTGMLIPFELEGELSGPVEFLCPSAAAKIPSRPEYRFRRVGQPPSVWAGSPAGVPLAHPAYCWAQVTHQLTGSSPWLPGTLFAPGARADQAAVPRPGIFDVPGKREFLRALQLGDALVARDARQILALHELAAFIQDTSGVRGFKAARMILPWVRAQTDSPRETWLRQVVIDLGFPEPAVNPEIRVEGRRFRPDLAWEIHRIDLEFHGEAHFSNPEQARSDVYRRRALQTAGWTVVEVTSADLRHPAALAARLAAAFARASQPPSP